MFKRIVWLWFQTKWKNKKEVSSYIKKLVDWWASEFFTWYTPAYWSDKFGFEVSPNWRFSEHEQIVDFETLKEIVNEVHSYNLEIFVNMNAWYYTDETFPLIKRMVDEIIEVWVDWIICWNITILEYLKSIDYKWKINISTILALYNTESIRFFLENYKVNKIILSRELTLKEIEKLVTTFVDTKFEVFWEWDFCRYNNWLCFAEHKYSSRDICTVVVNDLIYKKRFRPDFKKIILDSSLDELDKIWYFDDSFEDVFDKIERLLSEIENDLFSENKEDLVDELYKSVLYSLSRIDLFFDAMQWPDSTKNKKILSYYKWLKYLLENNLVPENKLSLFQDTKNELENSIKTWLEYLSKKTLELRWKPNLKALELWLFYAKWDNLNLYSYLFFNKFKNIETVKFPTRWRNYSEKINIIKEVVESWRLDKEKYLDRGISPERTHYDLTYLFWDKKWFREMLKNFKKEKKENV